MRRLCERPGCAGLAEVSYGMDNSSLTVWVDNRAVPEREYAGRLCRRHANALTVPRGWTIDDRRDPTPKLFRIEEDVPAVRKPREKRLVKEKSVRERPSLFENNPEPATTAPESVIAHVVDPDETQAIPWSPRFASAAERAADSNEDQPVFGRLLGRAFGQPSSNE